MFQNSIFYRMDKGEKIIIRNYDPNWAKWFDDFKTVFENNLGNLILSVEHVGSTSVVGLAAKPVIDLDLVIDDDGIMQKVIGKLEELGYVHVGDMGIIGREAFKRSSQKVPIDGSDREWINHHLYACKQGNIGLLNHLNFRDHLRGNKEAKLEYGKLKKRLSTKHPNDMGAYIEGKTEFIVDILKKYSFDEDDLQNIEDQNRAK